MIGTESVHWNVLLGYKQPMSSCTRRCQPEIRGLNQSDSLWEAHSQAWLGVLSWISHVLCAGCQEFELI